MVDYLYSFENNEIRVFDENTRVKLVKEFCV